MKKGILTRALSIMAIVVFLSAILVTSTVVAQEGNPNSIVEVTIRSGSITWHPLVGDISSITLTIVGPGNFYFRQQYGASTQPKVASKDFADGAYNYEVVLGSNVSPDSGDPSQRGLNMQGLVEMKQSGAFTVLGGSFVTESQENGTKDVVHADDLVVQGSICAGFDCVDNESFGFDTIRLKENNLRIGFLDTSVGAFPSNDWTIVANDSASGGANFLGFEDVTGAKFPFKVMAGAPTDSLFVSSNGDIGVRTSTPVLDFHANSGDTPGVRLEQNNGSGFTAQTWDIAGNEANFFIRDVTSGSRLPFRIRPGAPTSSIDISASGDVGIGTSAPAYDLDVSNTGANTILAVQRTDGVNMKMMATQNFGIIGTQNNFPLQFRVNNQPKMTLATNGDLTVSGAVNATNFTFASDRNAKENFAPIDRASILERLSALPISTWNYIEGDNKTTHIGPMAQDFHEAFGLGADDKHISAVDASGVAIAAIQELDKRNSELTSENTSLRVQVNDLTKRVSALETTQPSNPYQSSQSVVIFVSILLVCVNLFLAMRLMKFSQRAKA